MGDQNFALIFGCGIKLWSLFLFYKNLICTDAMSRFINIDSNFETTYYTLIPDLLTGPFSSADLLTTSVKQSMA